MRNRFVNHSSLIDSLLVFILGELPFQPFAGTRKDRTTMKRILDTKPTGCISGRIFPIVR